MSNKILASHNIMREELTCHKIKWNFKNVANDHVWNVSNLISNPHVIYKHFILLQLYLIFYCRICLIEITFVTISSKTESFLPLPSDSLWLCQILVVDIMGVSANWNKCVNHILLLKICQLIFHIYTHDVNSSPICSESIYSLFPLHCG